MKLKNKILLSSIHKNSKLSVLTASTIIALSLTGCQHEIQKKMFDENNTIISHYSLPANIDDFKGDKIKQAQMLKQWNLTMDSFTKVAMVGNPWSNENDSPRNNYLNPLTTQPKGEVVIHPITWSAFPNRVNWYFSTSQNNPYQISEDLLYALADEGRLDPNNIALQKWINYVDTLDESDDLKKELASLIKNFPEVASNDTSNFAPLKIPTQMCPVVNWEQNSSNSKTYGPGGPRGWKDEYNEWVVTRNEKGQITKISFTAENPEYWFVLWNTDPNKVLELYHQLVSPKVKIEDLYLKDALGEIVKNHDGLPVYNPLNKWNYGNNATEKGGGAAHLTSPPNTLGAEVYLGAAATMLRDLNNTDYSPQDLICSSQYGANFRNSDPNIGFQVNQILKNIGVKVTLANPIALYMQYPDFSNYVTPDGTPASQFFKIVRGKLAKDTQHKSYDEILHATFEVPKEKNYTVSDITINGKQIWWGSQVAQTFNQALAGQAYTGIPVTNNIKYNDVKENLNPNPAPQTLVEYSVLDAINSQKNLENATFPLLPPIIYPGTKLDNMALEAIDGEVNATIAYTKEDGTIEPNIKVKIKDSLPQGENHITGKNQIFDTIIYVIDIDIGKDVKPGSYGVQITNNGNKKQVSAPANLIVTQRGN